MKFFDTYSVQNWSTSHQKDKGSWITLYRVPARVDFLMSLIDFFEASILRHRFCNASWFHRVFKWYDSHQVEVMEFPITPEQLKAIDEESWDIWYGEDDD